MSRRERLLLIVSSCVIVLLVFYYYIYSPRQAEYRALQEQLADRQQQLTRMQATSRQAARLEAEYAELQAFIASVEGKLPTAKETPLLLVQLERLTKTIGIDLTSIKPSALEAPAAAASQPGRPAVSGPYQRYPINLNMSASYAEMLRLMNSLRDFPRLIVVRKVTVAPRNIPDLTVVMDVETFVLPKEAR